MASRYYNESSALTVTKPGEVYVIPPKLTPARVSKIQEGLLGGLDLTKACKRAGVSALTVRKWMTLGDLVKTNLEVLEEPVQRDDEDDLAFQGRRGKFVQGRDLLCRLSDILSEAEVESEFVALARIKKAGSEDWRADREFLKLTKPSDYSSVVVYKVDGLEELSTLCKRTGIPIESVIAEAIAAIKGTMMLDELRRENYDQLESVTGDYVEAEYREAETE